MSFLVITVKAAFVESEGEFALLFVMIVPDDWEPFHPWGSSLFPYKIIKSSSDVEGERRHVVGVNFLEIATGGWCSFLILSFFALGSVQRFNGRENDRSRLI